jgi:hypothetical protein
LIFHFDESIQRTYRVGRETIWIFFWVFIVWLQQSSFDAWWFHGNHSKWQEEIPKERDEEMEVQCAELWSDFGEELVETSCVGGEMTKSTRTEMKIEKLVRISSFVSTHPMTPCGKKAKI